MTHGTQQTASPGNNELGTWTTPLILVGSEVPGFANDGDDGGSIRRRIVMFVFSDITDEQ
jgi:hypothetical protein